MIKEFHIFVMNFKGSCIKSSYYIKVIWVLNRKNPINNPLSLRIQVIRSMKLIFLLHLTTAQKRFHQQSIFLIFIIFFCKL
ncbi:hypothetical protein HanIR_Chr02g0093071 [Helianthus annuus]|nr:hypothetical protein HanIR_Chr02g0093071 [Helianthus annuus]